MRTRMERELGLCAARYAYRARGYLLRNPDVLGYGVGFRFRRGIRTDEPALVAYVRRGTKSREPSLVARYRRVPRNVVLPGRNGPRRLAVDLVETDVGELCQGVTPAVTVCNCQSPDAFGTVGWVAKQTDGRAVFCSCYHVLLPRQFTPPLATQVFFHDPALPQLITCPCPKFGGNADTQLGRVLRGERSPTADLAIAEVLPGVNLGRTVQGIGSMGPPRKLQSFSNEPGAGEPVRVAVGHDAPIEGRLAEFPATFTVDYPDFPNYTVRNLIAVVTEPIVRPGDSGSLLVDSDRRPLGMLIGRDVLSRRSFYMPIASIMAFNLVPF
jgi:hypothetical protein